MNRKFAGFITALMLPVLIQAQVILSDDPIATDPDRMNIAAPAEAEHSEYYDYYINTVRNPGIRNRGPALNVNTLGEVPNSSWYSSRHYWNHMSPDELSTGPNESGGPAKDGPWTIISGKTQGITPGFTIKDSKGNIYLLKFDPPDYPGMTTGTELVTTKFFHALGYYVPENYLAVFPESQLKLSPKATTKDAMGNKHPLTEAMVQFMLERAYRLENGQFRAIASKFLPGRPLGPFLYYGTRSDDANDIIPHERRRELRGLKVFCAWLNHDDSRAINTLDMLVKEGDAQYIRHHLIDFGSTLGSGSVAPQARRAGNEYVIDPAKILKGIFSFGLYVRPWVRVSYPDYPEVGRLEGDFFDPRQWYTEYPNPAFVLCDDDDAFWAAKQVMNFSDEDIAAIVSTGGFNDPAAADYLTATLIKRRDKIGQAYLFHGGGLDRFAVDAGKLVVHDLISEYNLAKAPERRIKWQVFDNISGEMGAELTGWAALGTEAALPETPEHFVAATLDAGDMGATQVICRRQNDRWQVVAVKRISVQHEGDEDAP